MQALAPAQFPDFILNQSLSSKFIFPTASLDPGLVLKAKMLVLSLLAGRGTHSCALRQEGGHPQSCRTQVRGEAGRGGMGDY